MLNKMRNFAQNKAIVATLTTGLTVLPIAGCSGARSNTDLDQNLAFDNLHQGSVYVINQKTGKRDRLPGTYCSEKESGTLELGEKGMWRCKTEGAGEKRYVDVGSQIGQKKTALTYVMDYLLRAAASTGALLGGIGLAFQADTEGDNFNISNGSNSNAQSNAAATAIKGNGNNINKNLGNTNLAP